MTPAILTTLNRRAAQIIAEAVRDRSVGIESVGGYGGASVLNFAPDGEGTIAAGVALAKICMSGLGEVSVTPEDGLELGLPRVNVSTEHPLLACMAAQYAGWPLAGEQFFAMCSGPARALRGEEQVLIEYDLIHAATEAVGVLETSQLPPRSTVEDFARQCSVELENVTLCIARTSSLPGTLQVVARSVETALHKLHELSFDLRTIKRGTGWAPLPPIAKDDLTALGWTNDAILYGGHVELTVQTTDESIEKVIDRVASMASPDFGTPFLEIFESYDRDFYKIDKLLFSPAQIVITNASSGRVFRSGEIRNDILQQSFALPTNANGEDGAV